MSYRICVRLDNDLVVTLDKRYRSESAAHKALTDVMTGCVGSRNLTAEEYQRGLKGMRFYPPHRFRYAFIQKAGN